MKLSEKRKRDLYDAVREPIVYLRTKIQNEKIKDMDLQLTRLERNIWNEIMTVLLKPSKDEGC